MARLKLKRKLLKRRLVKLKKLTPPPRRLQQRLKKPKVVLNSMREQLKSLILRRKRLKLKLLLINCASKLQPLATLTGTPTPNLPMKSKSSMLLVIT